MTTLHRRLNPNERRWSAEIVEAGLSGLGEATLPSEVQEAPKQALRQYLFEPSFPVRMEALAGRVGEVLPGCVGRVSGWKRAVTDQQNALAHGLPPGGTTSISRRCTPSRDGASGTDPVVTTGSGCPRWATCGVNAGERAV